tara:strand:+ start:131 stop:826 length:696 start_codon:yes stop_codon:yes gene_type:complete
MSVNDMKGMYASNTIPPKFNWDVLVSAKSIIHIDAHKFTIGYESSDSMYANLWKDSYELLYKYIKQTAALQNYDFHFSLIDNRIIFKNFLGESQSVYGKSIARAIPKWMNYNTEYSGGWSASAELSSTIVVVEDIISAIQINNFFTLGDVSSYALMGTNLSNAHMLQICKDKPQKVYVCLDRDATHKAATMAWDLIPLLPSSSRVITVPLITDIKDMSYEKVKLLFKGHIS